MFLKWFLITKKIVCLYTESKFFLNESVILTNFWSSELKNNVNDV